MRVLVNKGVFVGCIIIVGLGVLMSVYPDNAYDTYNYHLVAQNPEFRNLFTEHFAKGNFQVWGFGLAEQLFYIPRCILGFRLGTLLNTFIMLISYLQIFELLGMFEEELLKRAGYATNKSIWALIIVLLHEALLMIGIYYVDILAVPIGLEVLRLLLKTQIEGVSESEIKYFAFLNGIWLSFKLTNVIYVVPLIIAFMVINYKSNTEETKVLSFEIVGASLHWSDFIKELRSKINSNEIVEKEVYL